MPDKTAEEFTAEGYFKLGDVGVVDERSCEPIVGRCKDVAFRVETTSTRPRLRGSSMNSRMFLKVLTWVPCTLTLARWV